MVESGFPSAAPGWQNPPEPIDQRSSTATPSRLCEAPHSAAPGSRVRLVTAVLLWRGLRAAKGPAGLSGAASSATAEEKVCQTNHYQLSRYFGQNNLNTGYLVNISTRRLFYQNKSSYMICKTINKAKGSSALKFGSLFARMTARTAQNPRP